MMQGLKSLFGRRRRYDDLSVSIQEHIAEKTEELIEEGMPREQAEQAARREFGNVTLLQERSREAWQWPAFESLLADIKHTFRRLRRSPGFAVTVLLTLAIGIGANTTVFSVVNGVLLKPLPYPDSDRVVALVERTRGGRAGEFQQRSASVTVNVFHFCGREPDLSVAGGMDPGDGESNRAGTAGASAHGAGKRRSAADARGSAGSGPLVHTSRPGSAWV
jgi:hypothetical protein